MEVTVRSLEVGIASDHLGVFGRRIAEASISNLRKDGFYHYEYSPTPAFRKAIMPLLNPLFVTSELSKVDVASNQIHSPTENRITSVEFFTPTRDEQGRNVTVVDRVSVASLQDPTYMRYILEDSQTKGLHVPADTDIVTVPASLPQIEEALQVVLAIGKK